MNRLIRIFAKLYPRAWRERYGVEFDALLDDALAKDSGANGRAALNVLTGAIDMQVQRRKIIGPLVLVGAAVLAAAARWVGQRPYVSPGTHMTLRMDSNPGALLGFLVTVLAMIGGLATAMLYHDGENQDKKMSTARRAAWILGGGFGAYLAAVAVVSLLTPRTIVSIGDGYCYDLWCIGVQNVKTTPQGGNTLYTLDVRVFSDANRVTVHEKVDFLYAVDEQGRRYPLMDDSSFVSDEVTLGPGESANGALKFVAPADVRKLYLTGERLEMPWVYLYFGSDIGPFHRRTLLRVS